MNRFRPTISLAAGLALALAVGACRDLNAPLEPAAGPGVSLSLQANAGENSDLAILTVEATGPGIPVPILVNLPFENGRATGEITVPAGRVTFTARAFDAWGDLTHEGSVTETIRPNNPPVRIVLTPVAVGVPLELVVSRFTIVLEPETAEILAGETLDYQAIVRDASGREIVDPVLSFASAVPPVASVDPTGRATGHHVGVTRIAVSFEGASALATLFVRSPFANIAADFMLDDGTQGSLRMDIPGFSANPAGDANAPLLARAVVFERNGETLDDPIRFNTQGAIVVNSRPDGGVDLVVTLAPGGAEVMLEGEAIRLEETQFAVLWGAGGERGRAVMEGIAAELDTGDPSWEAVADLLNRLIRAIGGPEELRPDDDDPFGLRYLRRILSADAPPAFVRISDDLTVRLVGRGQLVRRNPELPSGEPLDPDEEDPEPPEAAPDDQLMSVFNSRTLNEFQVFIGARLLVELHRIQEARGETRGSEGIDDPDAIERRGDPSVPSASAGGLIPQGWSNGIDTRIIRSPTTSYPWRTISQFTYGINDSRCSGTLIGPRHVVTAAHCINQQGTNIWFAVTVAPGRNGITSFPFGSSTASINPAPGTEVWYFTPWRWRDPNLTHRQWDWGLLVIPNRLGNQTGWMGYVAQTISTLNGFSKYNRGYPSCDASFPERPANCQTARLYGDTQLCAIGSGSNKGSHGWNRLLTISCDISRGHSGSPVYHYLFDAGLGRWVPVVSMVVVSQTCSTCTLFDFFPNRARRFTPGVPNTISWLRQTFP